MELSGSYLFSSGEMIFTIFAGEVAPLINIMVFEFMPRARESCRMAEAFVEARFQDAPAVPEPVRAFWREARDELMARGADAGTRDLEFLKKP